MISCQYRTELEVLPAQPGDYYDEVRYREHKFLVLTCEVCGHTDEGYAGTSPKVQADYPPGQFETKYTNQSMHLAAVRFECHTRAHIEGEKDR